MVDLQGLSMSAIDRVLEDAISEALLCELPEIHVADVQITRSDKTSSVGLLARPEASLPVLQEAPASISLAVVPVLALEDILASGGAPAPEGVAVGSPSAASMEVHVGSSLPRTDDTVATSSVLPIGAGPGDKTTLEVSGSDAGIPMGVALSLGDLEPSALVPASIMASADAAASGDISAAPALGPSVFLANLQVFIRVIRTSWCFSDGCFIF
jgi:hypothetical protein